MGHGGGHRRRGAGGDLRHALFHGTVHRADQILVEPHIAQDVQHTLQGDVFGGEHGLLPLCHTLFQRVLQTGLDSGGEARLQSLGHHGRDGAGQKAGPGERHHHRQQRAQGEHQPAPGAPQGEDHQHGQYDQVKKEKSCHEMPPAW